VFGLAATGLVTCAVGLILPTAGYSSPAAAAGPAQVVILDPTTNTVESVTPLTAGEYRALQVSHGEVAATLGVHPDISIRNPCDIGDGCYYGDPPYAELGFYGSSGTYHGNWPGRSGFDTGNYSAFACWTGRCSDTWPPDTIVTFTYDVTGTAFWIS
jgi:hypothetical protein